MSFDRKFLIAAFLYGIAGMLLGIVMAAQQNFNQHVTHAHILLIGFLLSCLYAIVHKLWLDASHPRLAWAQFLLHHIAGVVLMVGLYLLFGGTVPAEKIEPFLATASNGVFIALLLMFYLVLRARSL